MNILSSVLQGLNILAFNFKSTISFVTVNFFVKTAKLRSKKVETRNTKTLAFKLLIYSRKIGFG